MQRRWLLLTSVLVVLGVVALAAQRREDAGGLPELDRAGKSATAAPPVAVLLEMGLKDARPGDWSGTARVKGAEVVRRAGYRFRNGDTLSDPDGWQAASRRSVRAPKGNPVTNRIEPLATVGVIFYLQDADARAALTVEPKDQAYGKETVALARVLAGEAVPLWDGAAVLRLLSSAEPVASGPTEDDNPAAAYGPDGTLWVAYTSYTLRDPSRRIESENYKKQPAQFRDLDHPEYAEQLFLRGLRGGQWGEPVPVTDGRQDLARCAVAAGNDGTVWVVYSAHRGDNFDLYARPLTPREQGGPVLGDEVRLTDSPGPDLTPAACVDRDGAVWVACQSWGADGVAVITTFRCAGGKWSEPRQLPAKLFAGGNCWHPAIAADPRRGDVAVACDVYRQGQYDVAVTRLAADDNSQDAQWQLVAAEANMEARPSITFDRAGTLWVAYEYGPEDWGKDYGALDSQAGNPLYNGRTVRVACVRADGALARPAAELPPLAVERPQLPFEAIKTNRFERFPRYAYPRLGLDGRGRVWLTYRRNFGSRYSSHPGAYWVTFARRLDGETWTPEVELHHSDGFLDHRPVLLPHASGGLLAVHNTDGRFTTPETINNDVYLSVVDVRHRHQPPKLVAHAVSATPGSDQAAAEREAVGRIRAYRVKVAGKEYRLLRGEYHRHTEISWDGSPDGSLEDMFRYAIDAAGFDWIGNGDHDNGAGREYPWWLTQKFSDAYHLAGRFTPMFTYERSVSYPHGHRNVMFARRGILTLPRLAAGQGEKAVAGVHADDTKMLYRYLREFDGICAVHTSATGMGTDWRDNDPHVEPIVEIYQGDRMSYEREGAPRAGYDPQTGQLPANVAGWYPKGFVDLALRDKGYKLAFQASSDHWSTHISYFIVLAEEHSRRGILDAVKKRHTYGATDNIILDVRCGDAIQGDEVTTKAPPRLEVNVVGTGPLAKVEILKDSEVVGRLEPDGWQCQGTWTEPNPVPGTHYYYVRVLQADNEIAWGSPLWVTHNP